MTLPPHLPEALHDFICVTEVENGGFFVTELFQRKFGHVPPEFGRHIVAFVRMDNTHLYAASYLHFWQKDSYGLIGGGCTDGTVLRRLSPERLATVNAAGGLLRQTLLYGFERFAPGLEAFFGHCGDARAKEVDLAAGFLETHDQHLLVRWVGTPTPERQAALINEVLTMGAF